MDITLPGQNELILIALSSANGSDTAVGRNALNIKPMPRQAKIADLISPKIVVLILGLVVFSGFFQLFHTTKNHIEPSAELAIVKKPSTVKGQLDAGIGSGVYTFFTLPNGLDKAQIHDIVFHRGAMWLGTDKGLVKIQDRQVTTYRQFSAWPFEWIRDLVVTPYGIAVQTHVAMGNTGGQNAGSHIFNPEEETWQRVGDNVLAQAWIDGALYQAGSSLVRRKPSNSWKKETVLPSLCGKGSSSLKMKPINDELWITGEGKTLVTYVDNSFGCGVIRYDPASGHSVTYKTQDGLNHDTGWDLDGDSSGVFVSHSIKHNHLSHYDFAQRKWRSIKTGGSGNRIAVTDGAVWLAQATPRRPLRRIDRQSLEGKTYPPISDNEYISAIGVDGNKVWLGIYEKHWSESTYTITSRLGRVTER